MWVHYTHYSFRCSSISSLACESPSSCLWSPFNKILLVFDDRMRYTQTPGLTWSQLFPQGILVPFHVCKDHSRGTRGRFPLKWFYLCWNGNLIVPASHESCCLWASGTWVLPPHAYLQQPVLSAPTRPSLLSQLFILPFSVNVLTHLGAPDTPIRKYFHNAEEWWHFDYFYFYFLNC